jgi:hypothetical protein
LITRRSTPEEKADVNELPGLYPAGHRHLAARRGASAANVGALFHQRVVAERLARIGAGFTNVRADAADARMKARSAQHEIGAGPTDFHAIHQQPQMFFLGVTASLAEAVSERAHADVVTVAAELNASKHVLVDLL